MTLNFARARYNLAMRVMALQSGSNGNSVYVEAAGVRRLVDAGITGIQAKQRLATGGIEAKDLDALSAYLATMNMGTLTGAPKIEAMKIIRQLEKFTEVIRAKELNRDESYWREVAIVKFELEEKGYNKLKKKSFTPAVNKMNYHLKRLMILRP